MRIIGGQWRGRSLMAPKGTATRPTADAAREALFNILDNGYAHDYGIVLDLFAGTGALALEALSRGAEKAVLVESDPKAVAAIQKNLERFELDADTVLVLSDSRSERWPGLLKQALGEGAAFSTVFCDPPYGKDLVQRAMRGLGPHGLFAEGALLVAEVAAKEETPRLEGWELLKERAKGAAKLAFYRFGS